MSVIRALSACETNEQRDREKAKLEADYKISDQKLEELVSKHENDLSKVYCHFLPRIGSSEFDSFSGYAAFWFHITNSHN